MYRVIELFSGVGAQRMAFNKVSELTGIEFEFVAQCDIDKFAVKSYNAIHGETPNLGDITKVERLPECDILTWSFPCQAISQAGKKEGMKQDSGTTSSLAWEVIRLLEKANPRPEWLIMENVRAITYSRNIKEFNKIINALNCLGYYSKYKVINALDFDVAQDRERCFMISHHGKPVHDFPPAIGCRHTLEDYLESDIDPRYFLSSKRLQNMIVSSERERERKETDLFLSQPQRTESPIRSLQNQPGNTPPLSKRGARNDS